MTGIISYAQNFEDVLLWRALGHIQGGCYIDVGAHDPIVDSVSKAFYEGGWRGIHVEPLPVYCDALRRDRPDEMVLQAAVAAEPGVLTFFEIPDTGISTGDEKIAQAHVERGFQVNQIIVPCVTLEQVFQRVKGDVVHWLKIDVEGLEAQVLKGWGKASLRPWIVVVESTLPLTQNEVFDSWEGLLIEKGYYYIYFDGLNRYYLAEGKSELEKAFHSGPNVFDGFQFSGTANNPFCSYINKSVRNELGQQISALSEQVLSHESEKLEAQRLLEGEFALSKNLKQSLQAEQVANLQSQNAAKALALQSEQLFRRETETHLRAAAQREQEFAVQLLAAKDQLLFLEQAGHSREQELREQLLQVEQRASLEINAQLRTAAQREQEFNLQLLTAKDQYLQLEEAYLSQQSELLGRLAEVESQYRLETDAFMRKSMEREQAVAEQMLSMQQQAAETLLQKTTELRMWHDELELAWREKENTYHKEIAACRHEILNLRHSSELKLLEDQRLIESYAARETSLKMEVELAQENNIYLTQALNGIQKVQAEIYSSLTWRVGAKFRFIYNLFFGFFGLKKPDRFRVDFPDFRYKNSVGRSDDLFDSSSGTAGQAGLLMAEINKIKLDFDSFEKCILEEKAVEIFNVFDLFYLSREEFLVHVYKILLGRDIDPEGRKHYLTRLLRGDSKRKILISVARSAEAKRRLNCEDLLGLSNEDFIREIYEKFLGRAADHDGLMHYLGSLDKGVSRRTIIKDIEHSKEACECGVRSVILRQSVERYVKPYVGWKGRFFDLWGGFNRFDELDVRIDGLSNLLNKTSYLVSVIVENKKINNLNSELMTEGNDLNKVCFSDHKGHLDVSKAAKRWMKLVNL